MMNMLPYSCIGILGAMSGICFGEGPHFSKPGQQKINIIHHNYTLTDKLSKDGMDLIIILRLTDKLSKDGMDQSKWALPRHRLLQSSKESQNIIRPRMKIHGLWVHGVCLNLYLIHPGVPADSSLIAECFARALQDTSEVFAARNQPMPNECWVWVPWL